MGQEARCRAVLNGQEDEGKLLLETDELIFRGAQRIRVRFHEIHSVQAAAGELHVNTSAVTAVFRLGPQAEKWAHKMLHPKSLLDKLEVKSDARVALAGLVDEAFRSDLAARVSDISDGNIKKDTD